MMDKQASIFRDGLRLRLHLPGESAFYRGTRFDHSGVFAGIDFQGTEMAGPWFEHYDPYLHDAVQGPAEEYSEIGFAACQAGEPFLKIGVGSLTRPDEAPYDRFRLYPVAEAGTWEVEKLPDSLCLSQRIDAGRWAYHLRKEICLLDGERFAIRHRIENCGPSPLQGSMYNHHFFTLGRLETTPDREIDFDFVPVGHWRAAYDSVELRGQGLRFLRPLRAGESVYMGDLRAQQGPTPYAMGLRERSNGRGVEIRGDREVDHIVFWANHRIACVEPYIHLHIAPGETMDWCFEYRLF